MTLLSLRVGPPKELKPEKILYVSTGSKLKPNVTCLEGKYIALRWMIIIELSEKVQIDF